MDSQLVGRSRVLLQYLALAAAWGSSFLFIKIGLEGLSPVQVVIGRMVIGALTLGLMCAITRHRLPAEPVVWAHLTVVTMLLCVIPFTLFAYAEQHVSSALASIYNATTPLMTMGVALVALPQERLTIDRLIGLLTGFAGVLIVLAPWRGLGDAGALAQGACLLATACYGMALVYLRRFVSPRGLAALPVATTQIGLGAVLLLFAAPVVATGTVAITGRVVVGVVALGAFGTGLAYVWNTNIVASWGATRASSVTYLTPLIGVALGALLLSEKISWNQPLGATVVVAGVIASRGRLRPARTENHKVATPARPAGKVDATDCASHTVVDDTPTSA